jgi:DNA-binding transcriptional ArsR family regulator
MNTMTFKYNPGFSSDEDLIGAFVVREKELQQILQTLQENTGRTYQHLLLVGARGTGKTMLVRRVAAEVRRSEPLNQHWYPLVFGEESYRILSAGEFWLEAIYHLAAQNPGAQWQGVYEELRGEKDEKRLQQRAIAKLMDFADEQGKQILLIVENLNMLFDEQMSEGDDWDLRHTLQNEPRLMLLGTATQRFDQIDNVGNALFEFFALHIMEPLKLSECSQLWKSIADEDLSDNQIRPMQILTGGNPRLLQVLAGFAKGMSFRDLMANLTQLIDSHTDYFKGLLETLPATERRVFVELLEIWKPATANQIAEAARMEVSKTSALLNRLMKRGAIELIEQPGKKKYYQVAERLFNIYYLMRKRGARDDRVKTTIDFINVFYPDLIYTAIKIIEEAEILPLKEMAEHIMAVHYIVKMDEHVAENLRERVNLFETIIKHKELTIKLKEAKVERKEAAIELTETKIKIKKFIEGLIKDWIQLPEFPKKITERIIEISADDLVADDLVPKFVLEILTKEYQQPELEPLIVGLRIFLGENRPLVAQEIFEIGKDVADQIRTKQAELANSQVTE